RELARRTSHEPTLPAGAPARQSTVGRRFTDPRHRGSTQVPFLSMTWYGPLVVCVLCRVGLLSALRAGGCARVCGMQDRQQSVASSHARTIPSANRFADRFGIVSGNLRARSTGIFWRRASAPFI